MGLRPARALAALAGLALLAGCACGPPTTGAFVRSAPGEDWVRTELFFGLSRPAGGAVSGEEWQEFLGSVVTPRFPDGFTVLDGRGQWRSAAGAAVSEPSKVLLILHPPDPPIHGKLEEIRAAWKKMFGQESVLRATSPARASF